MDKVTVLPNMSLGWPISAGSNLTFPQIDEVYMVADMNKKYTGLNVYQYGVLAYQMVGLNVQIIGE